LLKENSTENRLGGGTEPRKSGGGFVKKLRITAKKGQKGGQGRKEQRPALGAKRSEKGSGKTARSWWTQKPTRRISKKIS